MLKTVNSFEPWSYRHSLCSSERWFHVRGGAICKGTLRELKTLTQIQIKYFSRKRGLFLMSFYPY